mmetsp:Transcript_75718/g.157807  ORF Transcript_75718/g.157807 Transcript_75718/m.157807 type:complete len:83 (-) Transcript_75718:219-467(-)
MTVEKCGLDNFIDVTGYLRARGRGGELDRPQTEPSIEVVKVDSPLASVDDVRKHTAFLLVYRSCRRSSYVRVDSWRLTFRET